MDAGTKAAPATEAEVKRYTEWGHADGLAGKASDFAFDNAGEDAAIAGYLKGYARGRAARR
jgi:hypothetical protein